MGNRGAADGDGLQFVLRDGPDGNQWVKDGDMDFKAFFDYERSTMDAGAIQRAEEKRRGGEGKRRGEDGIRSEGNGDNGNGGGGGGGGGATGSQERPAVIVRNDWCDDDVRLSSGALGDSGARDGVASGTVERVGHEEPGATRSLMHRQGLTLEVPFQLNLSSSVHRVTQLDS